MSNYFISVEEAQEILVNEVTATTDIEKLPLVKTVGRIAANSLCARYHQPPFDRSPLDGYAVYSTDLCGATRGTPVCLPVTMQIYAGDNPPSEVLQTGCAARIMTGAPIPKGADCVIRQEDTDYGETCVQLYGTLRAGQNICRMGEDIKAGTIIVQKGERYSFAHIGVSAAQGYDSLSVYRKISVAVLVTGSELLLPGTTWKAGKIYDSNGSQLAARLSELGFLASDYLVEDNPNEIGRMIQELLADRDALIITGGVSVGQRDYIPLVMERLGARMLFHGAALKPGSPMLAAIYQGKPIYALSGNPFAAAATFELLARPALNRIAGLRDHYPRRAVLTLTNEFHKQSGCRRFVRAKAHGGEVTLSEKLHSSGALFGMIGCNCLVDIPAEKGYLRAGDLVEVVYFD